MVMNRQKLERSHTQLLVVIQGGGRRESGIRAAQFFRHIRMLLGKSFDVYFVDDCLMPGRAQETVVLPIEMRIDHARQRRNGRSVTIRVENIRMPTQITRNLLRVRIKQQFPWIETVTVEWLVRAVNAIAIDLPSTQVRTKAMPDLVCFLRQYQFTGFGSRSRRVKKA